jgi:catechol-2,3-dioxygenase
MKIGHLRFKVRDVDRAIAFYTDHLKMTLTERVGDEYAFLSCGDAHHEIALMRVKATGPMPSPESTGFEHVAFELPDKRAFAQAFMDLSKSGLSVKPIDNGIQWGGASDELDVEVIQRALLT